MEEVDVLFFPLRNEQGFKVSNEDTYAHMINTIVKAQVELAKDFPDQTLFVVYEIEHGTT